MRKYENKVDKTSSNAVRCEEPDNKPIFIDPKKYPSPHMIIYDPVTDYRELKKLGGEVIKIIEKREEKGSDEIPRRLMPIDIMCPCGGLDRQLAEKENCPKETENK